MNDDGEDTEDTQVQIGHKHGRVIINIAGTSEVEPSFLALSPAQARAWAKQLTVCADGAESGSIACTYLHDHDPETLTPRGRACQSVGVEEIHWKDGRISVACREHGVDTLTEDARALVVRVVPLKSDS